MEVLPGVTAGCMMSATVGEISAMFLVVTRTKSKGSRPSLATSGTLLRTVIWLLANECPLGKV